ncbi:hypothetical protein SBY92_005418 [Candida maltosa Xu316]|uniref:Uncharacterized protein n=1 Tax=Candida maltosa (strain Xu316) TaxID=1245528 RepID=M3HHB0_CANMX|nr:hypothetical protein G210_3054 [Candida maltosa Xu316]
MNFFNNHSSPYDDLLNTLGNQGNNARYFQNNPNIKVKQSNKPDHHEIQIYNPRGYRNFKLEVVKDGSAHYLMVQSQPDRYEQFFPLNPKNQDITNVKSTIVNNWLVITVPLKNAKSKKVSSPPPPAAKKNPASPQPSKQQKQQQQKTKSPTPSKKQQPPQTKSPPISQKKESSLNKATKKIFSRGKKNTNNANNGPPSLLEAARRRPFLEEVADPGI